MPVPAAGTWPLLPSAAAWVKAQPELIDSVDSFSTGVVSIPLCVSGLLTNSRPVPSDLTATNLLAWEV